MSTDTPAGTPRYTVFGASTSRSTRVVWALEELGQPYTYVNVDFYTGGHRRPEYLAVNPNGKVPALRDGELTLFESAAIVTYLGDQHPDAGFVPRAGTPERGLYGQWCSFITTELEQPLWTRAKHTFALPESWRVPAVRETAKREFYRAEEVLAGAFADERPYLLGEAFTFADLMAGHTLFWAMKAGCATESEVITAYFQRILGRPALAAAAAREKAEKEAAASETTGS